MPVVAQAADRMGAKRQVLAHARAANGADQHFASLLTDENLQHRFRVADELAKACPSRLHSRRLYQAEMPTRALQDGYELLAPSSSVVLPLLAWTFHRARSYNRSFGLGDASALDSGDLFWHPHSMSAADLKAR